jgi:PAS domain S-box-containing protein
MSGAELLARGVTGTVAAVLLVDDQNRILLASEGAGRLLGWRREDLSGQLLSQFITPTPDQLSMLESVRSGHPMQLELIGTDGLPVPVEAYCHAFGDDADRTHCLMMIRDMTQRNAEVRERTARLAKLSQLNLLGEALSSARLTLNQILAAVLICVTAGQGLRFNRAFLLLIEEDTGMLQGEIAIGPSSHEEADRIWSDLAEQPADLYEMIASYDSSVKRTDVAVNEIVKTIRVPLEEDDHVLVRSMQERRAFRVAADLDLPGAESMRLWFGHTTLAVAPLSTRRGPLGVLVADNAISGTEITDLDLDFLQLFANEAANAIENSRLYHELERRLVELRKVSAKQKRDQETLLLMERLSVMGETSAIVAHELRNPLVAIGGFARTLHRSLDEDDPNKRFAAIITEEVGRLERIIHDLLDFIRPQKLLRKSVVGDELVAETAGHFRANL